MRSRVIINQCIIASATFALFMANSIDVSAQKEKSAEREYQADIKVFFTIKEYRAG